MRRHVAAFLLSLFPLICVGCIEPPAFDPANAEQVDQLVACVKPLAMAGTDLAVLALKPEDLIFAKAVLTEIKDYVVLMPTTAGVEDMEPLFELAIQKLVTDPERRPKIRAITNAALLVAAVLVPPAPPDSDLAKAALYSAAIRRVLLEAINTIIQRLPEPPVTARPQTGGQT